MIIIFFLIFYEYENLIKIKLPYNKNFNSLSKTDQINNNT